ncbi:hypothetical protein V1523DRAFT_449453, partial [Lipomyces doorenjongii]
LAHILNLIVKDILRALKSGTVEDANNVCDSFKDGETLSVVYLISESSSSSSTIVPSSSSMLLSCLSDGRSTATPNFDHACVFLLQDPHRLTFAILSATCRIRVRHEAPSTSASSKVQPSTKPEDDDYSVLDIDDMEARMSWRTPVSTRIRGRHLLPRSCIIVGRDNLPIRSVI